MKNKIKENWYKTNIYRKQRSLNIGCLIFFVIACTGLFILMCEILKFGFRSEERNSQQKFETYKIMETKLQEQREYKVAMFRERPQILYDIIQCESGGDSYASNSHSTALGIFQILNGTRDLCERNLGVKIDRTNDEDAWKCALWLHNRYGTQPWDASKHCWGR